MKRRPPDVIIPQKTISTVVDELAYKAKLHKPSSDWKTSEWDRVVDLVAAAMKAKD